MSATGERGATLIEAMVALAIMALAGTILFPSVERGYAQLELRRATERLSADLRLARAQALQSGRPVALMLAADGTSYAVGALGSRRGIGSITYQGSGRIVFFADGSTTGGLVTVAGRGRHAEVAVDPVTGALGSRGL